MTRFFPHLFFRVDEQTLFALPTERFAALVRDGRVPYTHPDGAPLDELCLVYDASRTELEMDNYAQDLDALLDHARLVRPLTDGMVGLELAEVSPLRSLLQGRSAQIAKANAWKDLEQLLRRRRTPLTKIARNALTQTGAYFGHLGTCTCGIEGCAAVYGWVEHGVGLLLVETSGGVDRTVNVLME